MSIAGYVRQLNHLVTELTEGLDEIGERRAFLDSLQARPYLQQRNNDTFIN